MSGRLQIKYQRRVEAPPGTFVSVEQVFDWEECALCLPPSITPFEAQAMAAGLRAETKNIRDVRVIEIREVARELG